MRQGIQSDWQLQSELTHNGTRRILLFTYVAVLASFVVGAYLPHLRIWGFNWWAYFPQWAAPAFFTIGAVAGTLIWLKSKSRSWSGDSLSGDSLSGDSRSGESLTEESRSGNADKGSYFLFSFVITIAGGSIFYLLRAKAHFFGDGYGYLKLLGSNSPAYFQMRELGESLTHLATMRMLGLSGEAGALVAFQVVSILTGVVVLIVVSLFARRLYSDKLSRRLFVLGLASGGYMLLYFGYVEHYGLLVCSVMIFTLTGLMATRGAISSWWIVLPLASAIFFHILGVTLIPAAVYVLTHKSRLAEWIEKFPQSVRLGLAAGVVVTLGVVFGYFYQTDFFFKYSLVPLMPNRVTAGGYTLFSVSHLFDFINLIAVLMPAWILILLLVVKLSLKKIFRISEYRYLALLILSVFGAAFLFDPRLGMPRDWDLFAFAGPPLVSASYYLLLDRRLVPRLGRRLGYMAVILSLAVLIPRAYAQTKPEIAVQHFEAYAEMDQSRFIFADQLLKSFFLQHNNSVAAGEVDSKWISRYPEQQIYNRASSAKREGRYRDAIELYRAALTLNPSYSNAYNNMGNALAALGLIDSALLCQRTAMALRPHFSPVVYNLGITNTRAGKFDRAGQLLKRSYDLDPTQIKPLLALVALSKQLGRHDDYRRYLDICAKRPDAPPVLLNELGDLLRGEGFHREATELYRRAGNRVPNSP